MNRDEWFETAKAESTTPFDYIIVGSGAGGGPLACRLALAQKHVLLIEAGGDPAKATSDTFPNAQAGEVHNAPGYMASSSEDLEMSWQYSVRHYEDTKRQKNDQKYDPSRDADGTGGVFYPRSSGLGGCTGHHAMIVVRPNDRDWNHIAELTNDDSWSASNMQPLFAKFENCLYLKQYRGLLPAIFDGFFLIWRAIVKFFTPRAVLDRGGHGTKGWQPTSLISPQLLRRIVKTDPLFTRLLLTSAFAGIERSNRLIAWLKQLIVTFGAVRQFDPNDNLTRERNPEGGVYLVPMGTGGDSDLKDERGESLKGRRTGVREFLLKTQLEHPEYLQIVSDLHVTEIVFDSATPPNAIGVKAVAGRHLYRASPKSTDAAPDGVPFDLYAKSEIILCCGTFNTPQLLMLSGIGDRDELNRFDIPCRVHLPGIGRNLQDRYEVGVISELKQDFSVLNRVSYLPGDPNDPERAMWIEKKEGLYSINGGTVVLLQRSTQADGPEPDLFSFGVPAAFRGYYWNWSRELFRPTKGAPVDQHNLWSWVILKAYTRNNGGRVRLRSACAFDTPDICFHSFDEGGIQGWEKDIAALEEAVKAIQGINEQSRLLFGDELQPARYLTDKNLQQTASNKPEWSLAEWIKNEAWGHHACGTCRIGSDQWQANTANLIDTSAVLDSRFQVHGVKGLRVVDASIFPKIPGYFILAPIFMASEKAALTILEDSNDVNYPGTIRAIEAKAVENRRTTAFVEKDAGNLTGLALSGGGIRSAAFSLGVLQALACKNKLRHVDFLSTVSGGGFTGGFLGRLFHSRRVTSSKDPCGRVQDILQSNQSTPMKWLRDNANYLLASGSTDYQFGAGIFVRNIMALYLFIGIFFLAICGSLVGISRLPCIANLLPRFRDIAGLQDLLGPANGWAQYVSVWWWLPAAMLVLAVIPMSLGFWLAPKQRSIRPTSPYALAAWVVLLVATSVILAWSRIWIVPASLLGALGLAWVWQELARRSISHVSDEEKNNLGELVRNALARGLGESLFILLLLTVWVVVDSVAGLLVSLNLSTTVMRVLAPAIPFAIMVYSWAHNLLSVKLSKFTSLIVGLVGVVIALALLIVIDMTAHRLFQPNVPSPWLIVVLAALFSVIVGRAYDFLNYSSWHLPYAARIRRCFLGASNDDRIDVDVQVSEAGDDLPHQRYRPEDHGGPLHLISVCINDTIEYSSQRKLLARRGSLMTIGTFGISVGRRYFANWVKATSQPKWLAFRRWLDGTYDGDNPPPALSAIPLNAAPDTFHPFARRDERSAAVESLSLGTWLAISGAAYSTGQGRATSTLQSLLLGLANVRLGYWWNSGIKASERAGQFPANFWRRLKKLPGSIFHTQWLLLSEWFGRFSGPSTELWNLSDGGHVESTALYELVRRRLPLIICSDATADPDYTYPALSQLVRMIRIDFGAELEWGIPDPVPPILANWINVNEYGSLSDLGGSTAHGGPGTKNAAVAKIKYADGTFSWLVYLKPSLIQTESLDVQAVAKTNPDFPQDATLNQFFDEKLWESYRVLGFDIVNRAFR